MTATRRLLPWLLALALVAAQALGLMHRLVHTDHDHDRDHKHGNVAALFQSHDEGDAECRLFDPLSQPGAAGVAQLVLPLVPVSFFLDRFDGEFLARWAALFDARGPPTLR